MMTTIMTDVGTFLMMDPTWRRPIDKPNCVPEDAVPLMWDGVIFGDYWITPAGAVYKKDGTRMPEKPHHTGYPRVSVIKNGKSTSLNVHNLVAYTFKPIPSKLIPAIDHVDVDKTNHKLDNLEFTGQAENTRRAYQEGANKTSVPIAQIDSDGNIVATYYSLSDAERAMDGRKTRASLKSVVNGTSRHKKAYGFKWRKLTWDEYKAINGIEDDE